MLQYLISFCFSNSRSQHRYVFYHKAPGVEAVGSTEKGGAQSRKLKNSSEQK